MAEQAMTADDELDNVDLDEMASRVAALERTLAISDDAALRAATAEALTLASQAMALAGRVLTVAGDETRAIHERFQALPEEIRRSHSELREQIQGLVGELHDCRTPYEALTRRLAAL